MTATPAAPGETVIAPARLPDDLAALRRLLAGYAAGLSVDLSFQGFAAELAGLPGAYAPPRGALLLARGPDGSLLGCVALRPGPDPASAEMKRLYVAPEARGLALGRRLALAALDAARVAGYGRVVLDTLPEMAAAQALYARLGFSDIAAYTGNPVPGARFLARDL